MAKEENNSQAAAAAVKSAQAVANNLSPPEEPPAKTEEDCEAVLAALQRAEEEEDDDGGGKSTAKRTAKRNGADTNGDTEKPAAAANNSSIAPWSSAELAAFLSENVDGLAEQANEIAPLLFENGGYKNKATLLAASREDLKESGIKPGPRTLIMKWVQGKQAPAFPPSVWVSLLPWMMMVKDSIPELAGMDEMPEAKGTKRNLVEQETTEGEHSGCGKKRRLCKAGYKPVTVKPPTFKKWYQGTTNSELFIRQCTIDCFNIMWKAVQEEKSDWERDKVQDGRHVVFIITGPPGLGKSWSSNTIVWRLVQRRQNLWFHSASEGKLTTVEFREGVGDPIISERPEEDVRKFQPLAGTWFLYDSVGGSNRTDGMLSFQKQPPGVFCVIFSSPKESNYKTGTRTMVDGLVRRLWMPSWEWPELEAVMECLYKEHGGTKFTQEEFKAFIRSLYELWGGIPRRLTMYCHSFRNEGKVEALKISKADFEEEIQSLSKGILEHGPEMTHHMLDQVGQRGESDSSSTKVSPPSWLVFPFPVDYDKDPYRKKTYKFCSQQAEVKFLKFLEEQEASAVRKFCMDVFKVPGATGIAFERFAHFVLTRTEQNQFRWKQYDTEGDCSTLLLPKCDDQKCDMKTDLKGFQECISQCIRDAKCMVVDPQSDQQDGIDMFVVVKLDDRWMVLAMQDTISKTHSFHPVKILEYKAAARAAFEIAKISVSDDFFLHVVVVPTENPEEPFRLQGPTMAKLANVSAVKAKFEAIGLDYMKKWNANKAKEACKSFRLKNYTTLKGDELLTAGAEVLLLERAAAKVKEFTWVLDGFLNP